MKRYRKPKLKDGELRMYYGKLEHDSPDVINEDGEVEYSASWPEACHDHIKDMQIEHGMGSKWKVRALKYLPVKTPRKKTP